MNKNIVTIIALVAVLALGYFLIKDKNVSTESLAINSNSEVNSTSTKENLGASNEDSFGIGVDVNGEAPIPVGSSFEENDALTSNVKTLVVNGSNYAFSPTVLTVNKGDKVKIVFKNTGGFHDLKIDEFKVATLKINGGAEDTVEFVADKTGSFEYYCSVGQHRQMGMKGTLIVK